MASLQALMNDVQNNTDAVGVEENTTGKPGDLLVSYPVGMHFGEDTLEACNFDYRINSAEGINAERYEVTITEFRDGSTSVFMA